MFQTLQDTASVFDQMYKIYTQLPNPRASWTTTQGMQ